MSYNNIAQLWEHLSKFQTQLEQPLSVGLL